MEIDYFDSCLSIKDSSQEFKTKHVSQICYWGFKKIENGQFRTNDTECSQLLLKLVKYFNRENLRIQLSASSQNLLDSALTKLNSLTVHRDHGANFKSGALKSAECEDFIHFASNQLSRKLKNHQLKSACHLYLVKHGAIFSVPGSGKTAVVLAVYEKLRKVNKVSTLVVIGPPACFGPWRDEFYKTLGRFPNYAILAGGVKEERKSMYFPSEKDKKELYFLTFQTLTNDYKELELLLSRNGIAAYLVIDEAHYIKQLDGVWAQSVLNLANSAAYRCVLTGTPMPRSLTDTFNLFDFLWPQCDLIEPTLKTRVQLYERDQTHFNNLKNELLNEIDPWFYRVRKSDLGLTEPVFHDPYLISMNPREREIYDAIYSRIRAYATQDYLVEHDVVARLQKGRMMRLRQCVSCAALLTSAIEGYDENIVSESGLSKTILNYNKLEVPAKLTFLGDMVGRLQKEKKKVIIWSNFVGTLEMIKNFMISRGYKAELIYGKTPFEQEFLTDDIKTRESIRNEFVNKDSGLDILVANPAACSESISLHQSCQHAIYYDLSYNCAQYLQSLDRVHRVGGSETKVSHYYFLQYADTIDQDIKRNLDRKADRMYSIIEQDCPIYSMDMFDDTDEIEAYKNIFGTQNE